MYDFTARDYLRIRTLIDRSIYVSMTTIPFPLNPLNQRRESLLSKRSFDVLSKSQSDSDQSPEIQPSKPSPRKKSFKKRKQELPKTQNVVNQQPQGRFRQSLRNETQGHRSHTHSSLRRFGQQPKATETVHFGSSSNINFGGFGGNSKQLGTAGFSSNFKFGVFTGNNGGLQNVVSLESQGGNLFNQEQVKVIANGNLLGSNQKDREGGQQGPNEGNSLFGSSQMLFETNPFLNSKIIISSKNQTPTNSARTSN